MHKNDLNKVVFHSKEDMAGGHYLQKGEHILRADVKSNYTDINEVLELYNLKKYIDNELFLKSWTEKEITSFKQKVKGYAGVIGKFMSTLNDNNVLPFYEEILLNYIHSFWELVSHQKVFKKISKTHFTSILVNESHLINEILTHKELVNYYNTEIKDFLLTYSKSAEILLSVYEVKDDFNRSQKFLPRSLTLIHKEIILSDYLESNNVNYNYIELIQNAKNRSNFKVSDKTRLKAKRLYQNETKKFFAENEGMKYGVTIRFTEGLIKIKEGFVDANHIVNYSYSLDFIKQNNSPYILFKNFIYLFEYVDNQNRINLVSKKNKLGLFEKIMGVQSQNEYKVGTSFSLSEMTSQGQIFGYYKVLNEIGITLEDILHSIFTISFQEKNKFAKNARFSIPSATTYFEKVRLLAPEFESALKQFKLFVEEGSIDFELLQISSSPSMIKDIPSLNKSKYIYFNEDNAEMIGCSNLFFSNQAHLAYVEPFKDKKYNTFFNLLANEQVNFTNYEDHQKPQLNYLIEKGFISVNSDDLIQITNTERVLIFKDLYENEVGSFYHYSGDFQQEVQRMIDENIIKAESSLFSKPEQAYFNYFLNKSEFTNGLDLRNSYLHGTQANPEEIAEHEYAYFTYLKLIFLAFLKIDEDLNIHNATSDK